MKVKMESNYRATLYREPPSSKRHRDAEKTKYFEDFQPIGFMAKTFGFFYEKNRYKIGQNVFSVEEFLSRTAEKTQSGFLWCFENLYDFRHWLY